MRVFPGRADRALVLIYDGDGDVALFLERSDVGGNLTGTHAEKVREVLVRRKTAALVVEAVDFHEQDFLHERKLL